jgi:hypothetical protein
LFLVCWFALPGTGWAQAAASSGAVDAAVEDRPAVSAEAVDAPGEDAPAATVPGEPDHPAGSGSAAGQPAPDQEQTGQRSAAPASSAEDQAADPDGAVSPRSDRAVAPASTAGDGTVSHGQPSDANTVPDAREPATPRFGESGQVTISGAAGLQIHGTSYSNSDAKGFGIGVVPALDYFVYRNFSIGGFVSVSYSSTKNYLLSEYSDPELIEHESSYIGVGPRIGYNIAFGEPVSWYLLLGFSYGIVSRNTQTQEETILFDSSEKIFALRAFAPLLGHLAPHFYVGFGPFLYTELNHSSVSGSDDQVRETTIGAELTVGGWL